MPIPSALDSIKETGWRFYKDYIEGKEGYIAIAAVVVGGTTFLGAMELKDRVRCGDFVRKYCGDLSKKNVHHLCKDSGLRHIINTHRRFSEMPQSQISLRLGEEDFNRVLSQKCAELLPQPEPAFKTLEDALRFDENRNEQPFYKLYPLMRDEAKAIILLPTL